MNHVYHQVKRNLLVFSLLFVQLIINSFPGYAGSPESGRNTRAGDTVSLPAIVSFTPASGARGTSVVILGAHFTGTTAVRFGGTPASSFTVISDSAILASVGSGASGRVSVTTPNGTASKAGFVFIRADTSAPMISYFTPASGSKGTSVAIIGSHFTGTTAVWFGGTLADTFFVVSDSAIVAQVGAGSSGAVAVTTPFGTAGKPGFTFINDSTGIDSIAPVIYNFSPDSASTGSVVTIRGSHFVNTTAVHFGGTPATSFTIQSDSIILAIVDTGSTGTVSVTNPFGTAGKPGFTFIPVPDTTIVDSAAPVIVSFTPTVGSKGTKVAIFGAHFTETTSVHFGGVPADTFSIQSDSLILAIVDTGSTGDVSVTTLYGTASKSGFTFIPDTTITDTTAPVIAIKAKSNINESVIANARVSLYPNPASGYAVLTHPATAHQARVQLVDLMGKVVRTINAGSNTAQTKINTAGLTPGMYKVVWTNGATSAVQTLLVK